MSEDHIRYTQEEAEAEAAKMQEAVTQSRARDYNEAERIIASDEVENKGETKEKTPGEMFVEKFYHPHIELPEELPDRISDHLQKFFATRPDNEEMAKKIWEFARMGVGNVAVPSNTWDDLADYSEAVIHNKEAVLPGGPGEEWSNFHHQFVTMALLYRMVNNLRKDLLERLTGNDGKLHYSPEEVRQKFVDLIDAQKEVIDTYDEILRKQSDNDDRISKFSKEEESSFFDSWTNSELELRSAVRSFNLEQSQAENIMEKARALEEKSGLLWFVYIRTRNKDLIEAVKQQLSPAEQEVYNDVLNLPPTLVLDTPTIEDLKRKREKVLEE